MGAILEEEYEQKKQILLKDIWYFYLLAMLNCWSRIVCELCYFAPYVWWLSLSKLQRTATSPKPCRHSVVIAVTTFHD